MRVLVANGSRAESRSLRRASALVHFGTWSVTEAEKTIVVRTEAALYPNQEGTEGKRTIGNLTADELKVVNQASGPGGTTEAVFRRAK
jgi:hypothetical protein